MIDEKDYHLFSKEKYDIIKRKIHPYDILKELQDKYVAEGKISVKNGRYYYSQEIHKLLIKEVDDEFDKIKMKENEELKFGDLTLKKVAEEYKPDTVDDDEDFLCRQIPVKYTLISEARIHEQQPLKKIKETMIASTRKNHGLIKVLDEKTFQESVLWDQKYGWDIPKVAMKSIMNALNNNKIILISNTHHDDDYSWIRIWKEDDIFKEKRGYEGHIEIMENVIKEKYDRKNIRIQK